MPTPEIKKNLLPGSGLDGSNTTATVADSGWLDGGAGQRGVGISKTLVVASTAMLGSNLYA